MDEDEKIMMKIIGWLPAILIALVVVVGIGGWVETWFGFQSYSFFAPKRAAVERQVFVNTPSFVQGTIDEIRKDQVEYLKETDPTVKHALGAKIIQAADSLAESNAQVPPDLVSFVDQVKSNR